MNTTQLLKVTLAALLASATLTLSHGTALAISCGDTLGPGGSYVLNHDLAYCTTNPALHIVGPVNVNLNGHTVPCPPNGFLWTTGILVEGHKAHVHNGTVKNCGSNVQLNNYPDPSSPLPHVDGSHHVEYIISRGAGILGFSSGSDNNHFNNNTAWNDTEGFVDFGSYNLFDFNEVNQYLPPQDEPLLGFFALGGQHSQFNYNTVVYSPPVGTPADSYLLTVGFAVFSNNASFDHNTVTGWNFGFLVDGFKNLLTYNDVNVGETNAGEIGFYTTTADPNFWGFNTQTPTANTFQSNTVSGTTYGFRDEGDSDIFRYNTATDNGIGLFINGHATHAVVDGNTADVNAIGIQVRGSSTKVLANTTKNNLQTGIFVEVNGSNKIQSNTASGNLFLDLRDVVPNCGSNVWKLNTFGTANQACIH